MFWFKNQKMGVRNFSKRYKLRIMVNRRILFTKFQMLDNGLIIFVVLFSVIVYLRKEGNNSYE